MAPLRVLIADDSVLLRRALRGILEASGRFSIVAEAGDGEEAVRLADAHHPDLVVLDLAMPVLDGFQSVPRIRQCSPRSRIVVLSGFSADRMAQPAVTAGADAYLEKGQRPDVLLEHLIRVCEPDGGPAASAPPAPATDAVGVLFDRAGAGMAVESLDGRLLRVNDEFCRIIGSARVDILGRNIADLVRPDDAGAERALRHRLLEGGERSGQTEVRLRTQDRRAAWVLMSRSLLRTDGGEATEVVTEVLDIRERKRAETLARRNEQTAQRHARELARSNEELAHFASVAAHDLRSPLQVISGFASLLERHYGPALDERGREFVQWIISSATRMESLIEGLLQYARAGAEPVEAVPVHLERVVQDVVAVLDAEIAAAGATVAYDPLPVVAGDVAQLRQLLQNLIANALKFVADGTPPVVRIGAEPADGGWCISVSDNGIGIDSAKTDDIFEMFKRLHPQDRYEGTGIGLAICKRIVEAGNGRIWVEARPGGGSAFRFTVPDAE